MTTSATTSIDLDHDGISYRGFTAGALRARGVPDEPILAEVKRRLKGEIDAEAERMRMSLITPGSGQAMEYQEAQLQAAAAMADANPTAAAYPMLAATIGIDIDPSTGETAQDLKGVARSILAARDLWLVVGAEIRGARLAAKAAIDAAASLEEAIAARESLTWPALLGA